MKPSAPVPINCNQYAQKQDVFLNGSPSKSDAGTYFFAVLDPGGQADPNDGGAKNLSDQTADPWPSGALNSDGSQVGTGFPAVDREFTVDSNGSINPLSNKYAFDSAGNGGLGSLSVWPFDDTQNGGGVYILATCKISDSISQTAIPDPTALNGDCKYDAFKVGSAEIPTADDLTVTKDANGADTNTFTWGIAKSVDDSQVQTAGGAPHTFNYTVSVTHDSGTVSGVQVTGTISVFNPNVDLLNDTVPVDITGVTDQLSDGTDCTVVNGGPQTLTTFETDFSYTCDLSSLPQGQLDNTVTVGWDGQLLNNGAFLGANSAHFTFTSISFAETKVDDCTAVDDTLAGPLGTVCSTDPSPTTFTYQHTFTDPAGTCTSHDNTATFTTNTTGTTGSASQTVEDCQGADLTVSKTATPAFTRTFTWGIAKAVDKTLVEQIGGTATFNYTVTVTHDSGTDSNWIVTGGITVHNPNDWEAVTLTGVTDAVDNGGSCTVSGDTTQTIAASSNSTGLTYTCTYASAPSPSGFTNTATATWDATAASTPDGSADGTATGDFGTTSPALVDSCVSVADPNSPNPPLPATVCNTAPSPKTFNYSKTVNVPSSGCVTYNNTATFTTNTTGTTGSASQTVRVCGPARTGALTMGFWQNKNGQGIITGGASTAGVCNSGTWLRQYAPFKDLSATATCAQVATYVTNIIKAANASGSSMNAMLKAQMLATALDVYFSDPALGGNKINAPAPIGGVSIDLTKICRMIDGSGGSATCPGTYENVSSAFGGASSLTVSQMLAYAASQSNSGGSVWYGQVKATQQLAKDAFDAINNQVAFSV